MEPEIGAMEKRKREKMLLRAAFQGNLRLLKKMARVLATAGQGEAAVLAAATTDHDANTALHLVAMEGRMDVLKYLVEDLGLDVNLRNSRGENPLTFSAYFGRTGATTYLLNHGADAMLVSKSGSPLHGAAAKGHCEIVELLLSRGASANLVSLCGTPLQMTALHGQAGTIKILLEHHADPNMAVNVDGTALYHAICSQSLECVKLLIEAGASMNFIDSNGFTYVMVAVNYGTPDIMKCLLDAGANPNIPDYFGTTPIEVAALQGRMEMIEILFPVTSPLSRIADWSINGIISHINTVGSVPLDEHLCQKKIASLKQQAADAFKREEYLLAGQLYTNAMGLVPRGTELAKLLSNRSICWLRLENGKRALEDATSCRMMQPHWPKAYYRQGTAFMLLKVYTKAYEAFADGLKLDPTNGEMLNALRECAAAMKNASRTGN